MLHPHGSALQFKDDQLLPEKERWYRLCQIGQDGKDVLVILVNSQRMQDLWEFGHRQPMYMDATHGILKYGLKLITVLVKDAKLKGARCPSSCLGGMCDRFRTEPCETSFCALYCR